MNMGLCRGGGVALNGLGQLWSQAAFWLTLIGIVMKLRIAGKWSGPTQNEEGLVEVDLFFFGFAGCDEITSDVRASHTPAAGLE